VPVELSNHLPGRLRTGTSGPRYGGALNETCYADNTRPFLSLKTEPSNYTVCFPSVNTSMFFGADGRNVYFHMMN